jgi:photosystem II stability/assembly factor-like uncharacterized protein
MYKKLLANGLLLILILFVLKSFSQNFWTKLNPFPISSSKTTFVSFNNGNLLAAYVNFWLSTDKGITWNRIYRAPYGYGAENLFIDRFNDDLFLTYEYSSSHVYSGVYKSFNNGYDWTFLGPVLTGGEFVNDLLIKRVGNLVYLFIGTGDYEYPYTDGIHKSTDGGNTWSRIRTTWNKVSLALDSLGNIYFGCENKYCKALLSKSTDNGVSWNAVFVGNECSRVTDIGISKDSTIVIIVGDYIIYLSKDLGNNWRKIELPNDKYDVLVTNDYIFVATDNGILFSKDKGLNWNYLNSGLLNTDAYKFHLDINNYLYVMTGITNAEIYKSKFPIIKPKTVRLISPLDNEEIYNNITTLIWGDNINKFSYHLQLALDSSFNTILTDTLIFSDTLFMIPNGLLNFGKSYYWRVRSTNLIDTSDWSNIQKFTIKVPSPILIFPECGSIIINNTTFFIWRDSFNIINKFRFQISSDSQFLNLMIDTLVNDNILNLSLNGFVINMWYFWRVKGFSELNQESAWSKICFFKILNMSANDDIKVNTNNFLRIYPNPINNKFDIKFKVNEYSFVEVKIFDILGREIDKLFSSFLENGEYHLEYKVNTYSSGIYFIKIRIGKEIIDKKIIISK